jgi:uncharacterized repeat protein (TIGR03803 family)
VKRTNRFALPSLGVIFFLGLLLPTAAPAQTPRQLFAFGCTVSGTKHDPITTCPMGSGASSLLQSADGNFYGTTPSGGVGNQAAGTVFKLTPAGQLTTIYTFAADQAGSFPNGAGPGGLIEGNDGFLYGTTEAGAANNAGTIFKVSKAGVLQVLHSPGVGGDYGLVLGTDGNLYGCGGPNPDLENATLFRITTAGAYTLLHTFNNQTEGPGCLGLILASDGNLYGTTIGDEVKTTTLFRFTMAGEFTILHTIHYGQFPVSAPVQAANGNLYGALDFVENGGPFVPGLFESDLSGAGYQQIPLSYPVGAWVGSLLDGSDGNFWGADFRIATGSIVSFTHDGKPLRQMTLDGISGSNPFALLQASDGAIFGLGFGGSVLQGHTSGGVIFTLEPALEAPKPLFVSLSPASGKVGSQVMIHGSHFVGATRVTFNGVNAAFKVLNTGNILATVPEGASGGLVAVTNAGGTAESASAFSIP